MIAIVDVDVGWIGEEIERRLVVNSDARIRENAYRVVCANAPIN